MTYQTAYPKLNINGQIKRVASDFVVEEKISFTPCGEGEHVYIWLEKHNSNTTWVSKQLARWANVPAKKVYFGGLKDRYAITRQWFSIHMPGQSTPNSAEFTLDNVTILQVTRHNRAFKSSALRGNRFQLRITQLNDQQPLSIAQQHQLIERIELIKQQGVPNYFGEQRFGVEQGNLDNAQALFNDQFTGTALDKRMAISAARSHVFNLILQQRIQQQTWLDYQTGDVCALNGSKSFFTPSDEELTQVSPRLHQQDIHLTGAMYGKGQSAVTADVLALEHQIFEQQSLFCQGLIKHNLPMERRALRSKVSDIDYHVSSGQIELAFTLNSGSYATAVISELIND